MKLQEFLDNTPHQTQHTFCNREIIVIEYMYISSDNNACYLDHYVKKFIRILHTCPCTCVSWIDDDKYPTCRNSGAFHHSHIMATEKLCFHSDQENVKTSVSFLIPWKVIIQHSHQDIIWQTVHVYYMYVYRFMY